MGRGRPAVGGDHPAAEVLNEEEGEHGHRHSSHNNRKRPHRSPTLAHRVDPSNARSWGQQPC